VLAPPPDRRQVRATQFHRLVFVLGLQVGKPYLGIMSGFPFIRPRSANTMRHIVTNLAARIHDDAPRRFPELAVFDARLYIRVRRIDEPA
jgi:hypothetical protein